MTSPAAARAPETGRVVACFGRSTLVETEKGEALPCVTRARRGGIACGDIVHYARTSADQGVIETVGPRSSVLYRSDGRREKLIAANVSQILIVLAVVPPPNEDFTDRCLAAAEHAGVRVLMVLNKIDHPAGRDAAKAHVAPYRALGYACIELSAHADVSMLAPLIDNQVSVLIGQSGVGKSTLLNRLLPDAGARVGAISTGRASGRHTTTRAELHRIGWDSALIDSPGMQAFGLTHLSPADLAHAFVEFRLWLGQCRFGDCRHREEPGCALAEAARAGHISPRRLASYQRILTTLARDDRRGT